MKDNDRLRIAPDLLALERGEEELLLANGLDLRPLYVRKGRGYVKNFLEIVSRLGRYGKIMRAFPEDAGLLDMLMEHAVIIPGGRPNEGGLPLSDEAPSFSNKKNMSLYLLVAQSCNMSCVYCLNGRKTYQKENALSMSREVAFRSVERCLDALHPRGFLEIVFFGGEPLLNWPLVKETILHAEDLKKKHEGKLVRYHVTANLSLLPADLIEWAKKYNITFLCDVDGPREIHDRSRPFKNGRPSYDIIAGNVRRLADAEVHVMLRTTATSLNHAHLMEATRLHKGLGARSSAFVPVNPFNSDEDLLDERLLPSVDKLMGAMAEIYESKLWNEADLYPFNTYAPRLMSGSRTVQGCGAPYGNTPVIDVNGDAYPCIYIVGIRKFYMGNIMDGTFPDMRVLQSLYDHLHVDNADGCKLCAWRYVCSGACPMGRLMVLDNPEASQITRAYCERVRCDYTRKIFELILWEKGRNAASGILEHAGTEALRAPDMILC
jgi:uncharacterized protein